MITVNDTGSSISQSIFNIRGKRVMIDADLALLYKVETKALNQAVKRNMMRFPPDFMFQLNSDEWEALKAHSSESNWGGRRTAPYVFTEHGAVMLASVLNSEIAIEASICVVRAFVQMRNTHLTHQELAEKVRELEIKYDGQFEALYEAVANHVLPGPRERIGFKKRS